jgi:glc operon protein GlcG
MKSLARIFAIAAALYFALAGAAGAQVSQKKSLTLEGARKVIAAAVAEARGKNAPGGVIAVVDEGGNLMALERLDNTFAAGANISIGKARTAVLFKRPTKVFEDIIRSGRTPMIALPDSFFTPLQGGIPIVVEGEVVGGVGVSGAASAQQDEELAIAGANVLAQMPSGTNGGSVAPITFIESAKISAAFAKGMPLVEVGNYKVHASRRDAPGQAEVHTRDTDIIYVLEGTATLVTGGTVVEAKTTAPEEIRGASIRDGETRRLVKGDFVIVPNGTPHWFKEVPGALTYYVVKVRSEN